MSKPNSYKGIGDLLNGKQTPAAANNEGKNIMAMLHAKDKPLTDDLIKEQPLLIDQLLKQENIKSLNLKAGRATYDIPLDIIIENDGNIRPSAEEIELTAKTILEYGMITPLTVFFIKSEDDKIFAKLLDGHRRIASTKLLISQGHTVDKRGRRLDILESFIISSEMTETEKVKYMFLSQMIKEYEPLQAAEGVRRIKEENPKMSAEKIAAEIGRADRYVRDLFILLEEPEPIKQLVRDQKITYTAVAELKRTEPNADKRLQIILESLEKKGTFTTTDVRARKPKKQKEITEPNAHLEETGKEILGAALWKFGKFIEEIKKGDIGAQEIKRKIATLQEQPDNPISVYHKLQLLKNHLVKWYSAADQETFGILTQFLSGEIEEGDLLRIGEERKIEEENK